MPGARGPLKLPAHLRAVNDGEPAGSAAERIRSAEPEKPEQVAADADLSGLWDSIVPELDRAGLIAPSDGPVVELALRHFLVARKAFDQIGDNVTVNDHHVAGGLKKHPAEAVFRSESDMFLRYANQLGMTFVSRARTPGAKEPDDGAENPFTSTGS
ncbi:phage terminase, small subunit, putative, P27 family [Frankineae bacterium MT45]|nr:phage terminase, small subunit, putative, P27 family [Frankineae bacterium MT45]